ncbi:MAG: hypothetical protein IT379_22995 [Deltaproteobacteria bacterium]|nr:hypothetical protein [Deltaproteobacteria bacterium]
MVDLERSGPPVTCGTRPAALVLGATPAEIVIVMDTSASMGEPSGGPDGETKLELASRVATEIARAAVARRHRVGLVRFRQIEQTVQSGQGLRTVHVEDEEQCRIGADLIVPVGADGAEIARWVDGVEAADNPELVALGDSPLYAATRIALRYVRSRRLADPRTSCVNAFVVVLTDGRDTCAAGADLQNVLGELRAQSVDEDIRGLVLAFDPEGEAAVLLSRLGHEVDSEARAFAPDEADELVSLVAAVEGRLAPEACVASGVAPEEVGLPPAGSGSAPPGGIPPPGADPGSTGEDDGGCSTAGGTRGGAGALVLLALLAVWALERRRHHRSIVSAGLLSVAALPGAPLAACGDDGAGTVADAGEPIADAAPPEDDAAPPTPLPDPSASAEEELERLSRVVALARTVRRDHLAPTLVPDRVFDGLEGDPVEACLGLTRSFGYEPYAGAQRGIQGCIATRRCNALDAALVLEACLDHHGVAGEIRYCRPSSALRPMLAARSGVAAVQPDLAAAEAALRAGLEEILDGPEGGSPGTVELIDELLPDLATIADHDLTSAVDADVELLRPLIDAGDGAPITSADSSARWADSRADIGHRRHYYVALDDDRELDPVLDGSPLPDDCDLDAPVALGDTTAPLTTVRMQVLVGYADATTASLTFVPLAPAGEISWNTHERWGEPATVAIVDAASRTVPDGTPPPATADCLRPILRVGSQTVVGDAFFLQAETVSTCPETPSVEAPAGRHLASVVVRTEVTANGETSSLDRVLVDRYGYARREDGAHASGPMFSIETARSLVPMRIDLTAASGIPGPHHMLDAHLGDVIAREGDLAREMRRELAEPGEPSAEGEEPEPLPKPYVWTTLSAIARHLPRYVSAGAYLLGERPWRIGVVRRRGFAPVAGGLVVAPLTILDIHEMPLVDVDHAALDDAARAEARLQANVALGALATEAERLAMISYDGSREVVHAGEMLRDPSTGPWAPYGTGEHGSGLFARAVTVAHRDRMLNDEVMLVTRGPVSFGGVDLVAWWRVHYRTGMPLGEIRYDGTFYGGVAMLAPPLLPTVVGAIGEYNACLWSASILAFQDGRSVPDVQCCFEAATSDLVFDMVLDHGAEVLSRLTDPEGGIERPAGGFVSLLSAARLLKRLNSARDRLEDLDDVTRFYDSFGRESACLSGG